MRLILACVGRNTKAREQALCDDYLLRARALGPRLGFSKLDLAIVETSRAAQTSQRIAEEAGKLANLLPAGAHGIALDEGGRAFSSEAFAEHLAALRDDGIRDVGFIIGGPDGLAPDLRDGVKERMSFGPQTWPHLLVRVMLAEQIYRALAILGHHPYHRAERR
jgi:23S rRNA (pseudouridine1915-N3)-methyltransferase